MTSKLSKFIVSTAIIATAGLLTTASFADTAPALELQPPQAQKPMKLLKPGNFKPHRFFHRHHRCGPAASWQKALRLNKNITKEQAQILTKAAIIMYANPKMMKVGNIKPIKLKKGNNGYLITLVDPQGAALKTIKMNAANGHVRPIRAIRPIRAHLKPIKPKRRP